MKQVNTRVHPLLPKLPLIPPGPNCGTWLWIMTHKAQLHCRLCIALSPDPASVKSHAFSVTTTPWNHLILNTFITCHTPFVSSEFIVELLREHRYFCTCQAFSAACILLTLSLASCYSFTVVGPAVHFNFSTGMVRKSTECGIWLLIIVAHTSCLFYRPALSCRHRFKLDFAGLCRRDFVLHKYLLFISDIRERLAYERHLSTYPPSDRDRRYYSKWLQFVSPHATRPIYISPDSPQQNATKYAKTSRFYRVVFALRTLLFVGN